VSTYLVDTMLLSREAAGKVGSPVAYYCRAWATGPS